MKTLQLFGFQLFMPAQSWLRIQINTLPGSPACTSKHEITKNLIEIGTSQNVIRS